LRRVRQPWSSSSRCRGAYLRHGTDWRLKTTRMWEPSGAAGAASRADARVLAETLSRT
jgi:hypothetical protein